MSRLPRMSDTIDPVAGSGQSLYALVTNNDNNYKNYHNSSNNNNNNNTQIFPQRTNVSTLSTTGKRSAENQEPLSSASIPVVPDGRHLLVGSGASNSPVQPFSPIRRQSKFDPTGEKLSPPVRAASTDRPSTSVLGTARKRGPKRGSKRTRADNDDVHALPAPRRSSRRAKAKVEAELAIKEAPVEAKVLTETDVCRGKHGPVKIDNPHLEEETFAVAGPAEESRADNHDEPSESKRLTKKRKARLKTVPKGLPAATGRRRANAPGRKRKTKCKHNLPEQESGEDASAKGRPDQPISMTEAEVITMHPQASDAETPKGEAQGSLQPEGANCLEEAVEELPKKLRGKRKPRKKTTGPPERTSTRNRRAPERFEILGKHQSAKASPVNKGSSKVFDPIYITTKPSSRLGKADMHHMLLEDTAWTCLSAEQQATLVSMLPETVENQQLLARIKAGETENTRPRDFTLSNDCFRTDVAKFQEDLKNGHLVKAWQEAAEQAVIARAAGEYDAWKAEEAELWWGQKSK